MYWISSKTLWIPLYLFLLYLIIKEYKWNSLYILLMIAILITLSDQISTRVLKFGIERFRPCHEEAIKSMVHLVNGKCGGKFGFVSSHASNSFALAVFVGLLFRKKIKYLFPLLLLWASLIAYSRVYLGVHYPGDVLGGALLGIVLAYLSYIWITLILKHRQPKYLSKKS